MKNIQTQKEQNKLLPLKTYLNILSHIHTKYINL